MVKIKEKVFDMFLDKYVDQSYLNLIYSNYNDSYLNMLDESNFKEVYDLLVRENIYFIDDVILNYLELFEIDVEYVSKAFEDIKDIIGSNFNRVIGKKMIIIDKIIQLANSYSDIKE